jgi:hypothetical protein
MYPTQTVSDQEMMPEMDFMSGPEERGYEVSHQDLRKRKNSSIFWTARTERAMLMRAMRAYECVQVIADSALTYLKNWRFKLASLIFNQHYIYLLTNI